MSAASIAPARAPRGAWLAFALALVFVPRLVLAHPAAVTDPAIELPAGLALRAGQSYEIHWSAPDGSVDEMEILLSIDGGRRFALRVSPEIDARAGKYVWRVPNLSSAEARLRVRFHRGGQEIDGASTAAFTLLGSRARETPGSVSGVPAAGEAPSDENEADRAPVHEGTWWTGLAFSGGGESLAASESPSLYAAHDGLPSVEGPRISVAEPALDARAPRARPARSVRPALALTPLHSCASFPLRN